MLILHNCGFKVPNLSNVLVVHGVKVGGGGAANWASDLA